MFGTFSEALTDDVYSPSTGPGHFVVTDQNVETPLSEDPEGTPLPRDTDPVDVVVGHGDVLRLRVAYLEDSVVTCHTSLYPSR